MAKLTLNNVTSGYQSSTASNANNDLIEAAVENTISRDGSSPNQMEADLDLNSNDILNVEQLQTGSLVLGGVPYPGGTVAITNSDTAPANPVGGQFWYKTSNGRLYVYYTDADSSQWVEVGGYFSTTAPADSSVVPHTPAGTSAVATTVKARLDQTVSVKDFGATGDGIIDDTTYIQAAIDWAQTIGASIYFPAGIYRTTAALTIATSSTKGGVTIYGEMPKIHYNNDQTPTGEFLGGTWFHFDHTGKGFTADNSATGGWFQDIYFHSFGTYRTQPVAATSWAPTAHDWDFYFDSVSDVTLKEITLLNPTKGIRAGGANQSGRLNLYNIRMEPFDQGIEIDGFYDVCRLDQIHMWPFWNTGDADIKTYHLANTLGITLKRCDNPMLSNIFTIFLKAGLVVAESAYGKASKIHLTNADFDNGVFGIWVDTTSTTGATGQFANVSTQGNSGTLGTKGFHIQGDNTRFELNNVDITRTDQNAIRVEGTGNKISLSNLIIKTFDVSAANFPAVEALNGNTIEILGRPNITDAGGSGGSYKKTTGTIIVDEWRSWTPTVTASTGTITTVGDVTKCLYKIVGNTVHVQFNVTITTNGTGAGRVQLTLPHGTPVKYFSGSGAQITSPVVPTVVVVPAGGSEISIFKADGAYPAVDGSQLVGVCQYDIA